MSPNGFFDETTNPPSSWAAAPSPTGIFVTPGTATTAARVRLEWNDNAIENRWLQIQIRANSNTGLPRTEVYYVGHLRGEIDGEIVAGAYFVSNADLTAVLPVGQLASVNNVRDVDKDRFVLNADLVAVRAGITSGSILRNITIPAAGSVEEGGGTGNHRCRPAGSQGTDHRPGGGPQGEPGRQEGRAQRRQRGACRGRAQAGRGQERILVARQEC